VRGSKRLAVTGTAGLYIHDPAGTDPGLTDVLWSLFDTQYQGDIAAVADLLTIATKGILRFPWNWLRI